MLLLKRRVGESIVIGGSIRVNVVEIRGGSVRIAAERPDAWGFALTLPATR